MAITIPLASPSGAPSTTATLLHLSAGLWVLESDGTVEPIALHSPSRGAHPVRVEGVTWLRATCSTVADLTPEQCTAVVAALGVDTSAKTTRGLRAAIERHIDGGAQ